MCLIRIGKFYFQHSNHFAYARIFSREILNHKNENSERNYLRSINCVKRRRIVFEKNLLLFYSSFQYDRHFF